jgi:ribonuclease D
MSYEEILVLDNWKNYKFIEKQLKQQLKVDNIYNWKYPKVFKKNERLIFLLKNNIILSVLHITINSEELEFSFSFTPVNERRNGYNKKLRLYVINKFKEIGINKFTSTPFSNSNSIPLLKSLGFIKKGNQYKQTI